ncbi:MAG: hypothetical protein IJD04_09005, partial [Desulfovibrionaceae bacterium]|nr:hypothetical protein [Desulfovibrionaceae bacterium]
MNKKLIHYAIGIILMLVGHLFPDGAVITALGYQIMFIFIGALYLWCTTDMFWPSLLALVMLGTTSHGTAANVLGSAMSNTTVMQMFFMMLVAGIAKESGLISYLARKIIQSNFAKKYPWGLTCSIMIAAFLGAGLVSGIPSLLICWALIYQIAEQVGYKKQDKWPTMALIGAAYAACFGVSLMPYNFTVVGFFGITKGIFPETDYNYLSWVAISTLIFAVGALLYLLCCKFIFKPDLSYLKKGYNVEGAAKLDGRQKKALSVMGCMIVVMMLPSILPKGTPLHTFFNGSLGVIGTAVLAICAALMLKHEGKPFITFADLSKNLIW